MCKKENQIAPEDAYVAYKDSKFEIVPETEGILWISMEPIRHCQKQLLAKKNH